MPQVRNTRDRLKRELEQAIGLLDTVSSYVIDVGSTLYQGEQDYSKLADNIKSAYPAGYADKLSDMTISADTIIEGIEAIILAIKTLHDTL